MHAEMLTVIRLFPIEDPLQSLASTHFYSSRVSQTATRLFAASVIPPKSQLQASSHLDLLAWAVTLFLPAHDHTVTSRNTYGERSKEATTPSAPSKSAIAPSIPAWVSVPIRLQGPSLKPISKEDAGTTDDSRGVRNIEVLE